MDKINIEKGQCVYLSWLDSTNILGGWMYEEKDSPWTATPKEIETVGFVLAINERALMLSSTRSNSGGTVNPIVIPLGCIQDYKIIDI